MSYDVQLVNHRPFTDRLNSAKITGPLRVVPAPYVQSTSWRASSLSGCLRQVGYRLAKATPTHDTYNPDWTMAADVGTALHTRIQEQLVASGLAVTYQGKPAIEVELATDLYSGHVDAIVATKAGTNAIFDLKSVSAKYLDPENRYLAGKVQGYAVQVHAYMAALPEEHITEAYVLVISRDDTSDRLLYRIPWQPERWAEDFNRLRAAQMAVASGQLPEPEPGACRFCSYRGACSANNYHG